MDEDLIRDLATRFREALESFERQTLPIQFREFPRGSCGDTSLLLGTYLQEQGQGEFTYICGLRGEGHLRRSHAWIERDGLTVDITADQFEDAGAAVIVARQSAFHLSFERSDAYIANYRQGGNDATSAELEGVYRRILEHLGRRHEPACRRRQ
ncbi:MAG: hypothetical protein E5X53_18825 [Mesorhizobium sp.]|uniref:hypothetical protein n=1 Tax=Mesorhizobium sp. TaxID=1871066 RepID=UPI0011FCD3AB|nr:hypothetical protein [Mesorhizobium sp.]TIR50591.1 MAG: hypothetical protein E5X53_18825 [Mesorhizobium sp.]